MNVYVSTKFSDLSQNAELLSIGMIIEQPGLCLKAWYSEINNPDTTRWSKFVKEHDAKSFGIGESALRSMLKQTLGDNNEIIKNYIDPANTGSTIQVECPRKSNFDILANRFYNQIFPRLHDGETVTFIVDVGFYTAVLINSLLNHVRDLSGNVDPAVGFYDVNQVIADTLYDGNPSQAFDASRENLVNMATGCEFYKFLPRYHAFSDAFLVYMTYKIFKGC